MLACLIYKFYEWSEWKRFDRLRTEDMTVVLWQLVLSLAKLFVDNVLDYGSLKQIFEKSSSVITLDLLDKNKMFGLTVTIRYDTNSLAIASN